MKVLFISNYLYLDGPPIALFRLIKGLKTIADFDLSLLSFLDGPLRKWYEELGIKVTVENLYNPSVENIQLLVNFFKKQKPDLVLVNMLDSINGCFAANICRIPSIFYIHEDWPEINLSTLHLFAYKLSDLIVFPAKCQREIYRPLLEGVPTKIISNGLPFEEFNPDLIKESKNKIKEANHIPLDKKVVSVIGIVCNRKRQDLFVFAAHEILKKRDDIVFLIIGRYQTNDSYYQLLKKYIELGQLESKIMFLGEKEDVRPFYHISDVIVCPSSIDISPLVILEALAFKKPVVATDIDDIAKMVKNGHNGILIEDNNQAQLIEAIGKVLDNYDYYQTNLEKDYEIFRKNNSLERTARLFLKAIKATKFRKKKYRAKLRRNEIELIARQDTILRLKTIKPIVERKASSAFR